MVCTCLPSSEIGRNFNILIRSTPPRRDFIEKNAVYAKLDV